MSSTPNYVKEAVLAFIEKGNGEHLATMFKQGIPLHEYSESCEIVTNLILGKSNRKRGRQPLSRDKQAMDYRILMHVAELYGAGFPLINNGASKCKSACQIVADIHGISESKIYNDIWKPHKDSDAVIKQVEIGKANKTGLQELY